MEIHSDQTLIESELNSDKTLIWSGSLAPKTVRMDPDEGLDVDQGRVHAEIHYSYFKLLFRNSYY